MTFVGAPIEVVRTTSTRYLDQARNLFSEYISRTLAASMAQGGRYNPPGIFGAIYCASDEHTAWEEIAARFDREGIPGLPPTMGLLRLLIRDGQYADLTDPKAVKLWDFDPAALTASAPTAEQREHCHHVGTSIRPVADFLFAPSARAEGKNIPVFPDRESSGLIWALIQARPAASPSHLVQESAESW